MTWKITDLLATESNEEIQGLQPNREWYLQQTGPQQMKDSLPVRHSMTQAKFYHTYETKGTTDVHKTDGKAALGNTKD